LKRSTMFRSFLLVVLMSAVIFLGGCSQSVTETDPDLVESFEVQVLEPSVQEVISSGSDGFIPLADLTVKLGDYSASTDENGRAVFNNLETGTYELSVAGSGYEGFRETIQLQEKRETFSTYMYAQGSAVLDPREAVFNKLDPDDVETEIDWQQAEELEAIYRLLDENDYRVYNREDIEGQSEMEIFRLTGSNTLVIKEDYLSRLAENEDILYFFLQFDQGSDLLFTVDIISEEVTAEPKLEPTEFDFYLDDPADITSEITWNNASEITDIRLEVSEEGYDVQSSSFEALADDTLRINQDLILAEDPRPGDVVQIKVSFDYGDPIYLKVNVKQEDSDDPDPEPGEITVTGSLDLIHSFPSSAVQPEDVSFDEDELWSPDEVGIQSFQEERDRELIVRFGQPLSREEMKERVENKGYQILDYLEELQAVLVELPEAAPLQTARAELSAVPEVQSVEANKVVEIFNYKEPNDEYYYKQWAPPVMRLPQTWRDADGSSRTRMAVIDTGIADNNLELTDFIDADSGYNFIDDNDRWMDGHNHGTHVAGIISAKANNSRGVVGVMWDSELIPVKVLNDSGSGSEWSVAQGILYAAGLLEDNPIPRADVINLSLGLHSDSPPQLLQDAVQRADREGVIMVAAAGNSGQADDVGWPAAFEEVIAVSALTYEQNGPPSLASYSSYGPEVELSAPGTGIWSTITGNYISSMSGTSMAAPQVAGLAGLLIAEGVASHRVPEIMKETAFDLGAAGVDDKFGHGMINTYWGTQGVSEIRIMVGSREGDSFNSVRETTVPLDGENFTLREVPAGEYEIMAWIDVRNTGSLEPGDYFAGTEQVVLEEGTYSFELELEEIF